MPRLSKEKYEKIIKDYQSGITQEEVGELNGICRDAVGKILKRFNVDIRSYTGERDSNKKWFWNTNFFNERNSIVAYWAGFLMADGSLSDVGRSYTIILLLQDKDKHHIERFCDDINLSKDAIYYQPSKGRDYYCIHLNYVGLPEQMLYWGIVPRKTYNFIEPQVSIDLLPHYLRGWADGDGQIYASGDGARFTVSGNTKALKWYENSLVRLGYSGNIFYQFRNENYSVLYISGANQTKQVLDILDVENNNLKLERKWNVKYKSKYKLIDVICDNCGKTFGVRRFRYNHPTQGRFCSKSCFYKSLRKSA